MPLYGMRWILIILNEYLPNYIQRRQNALNFNSKQSKKLLKFQLNKAINYCNIVRNKFVNI